VIEAAAGKAALLPGWVKEHHSEIKQMIRLLLRASLPLLLCLLVGPRGEGGWGGVESMMVRC
jgi:hypothetical protein